MKCARLRRELRLKYLRLEITRPSAFVESVWLPRWVLWLTRSAMASVCLSTLLYTAIETPELEFRTRNDSHSNGSLTTPRPCNVRGQFFLCYLTIWSYIVILLYFLLALLNMATVRHDRQPSPCSTACMKLQWLLCGIGCNAAVIVTLVYWAVLHPMAANCDENMPELVDVLMHLCNTVFLVVELATSGVVVHPIQCVYTAAYGLVYMLFSLFYWIPDHSRVIYNVILDWNTPGVPVLTFLVLALVVVPAVHLLWWLLYLLRVRFAAPHHGDDSLGPYKPLVEGS